MTDLRFEDSSVRPVETPRRRFRLDKQRGKLMGVSAGIADYFGIDVTLVRIAWVVGTLAGFGSLLLVYLAIGLIAD
ncbi:PspC domain-containing protein [Novosphingobium huizhouense]|uniref:PspC domain-containing protein n=1 Tax=Novosphingobium huizhouense TaxID=2866625 RepID=UPI001CD84C78|nr:PspC domain-containing protein [Novosphingobium huizhouense]